LKTEGEIERGTFLLIGTGIRADSLAQSQIWSPALSLPQRGGSGRTAVQSARGAGYLVAWRATELHSCRSRCRVVTVMNCRWREKRSASCRRDAC
jgi:hypothetical protein